jgi:hypothetical protein
VKEPALGIGTRKIQCSPVQYQDPKKQGRGELAVTAMRRIYYPLNLAGPQESRDSSLRGLLSVCLIARRGFGPLGLLGLGGVGL